LAEVLGEEVRFSSRFKELVREVGYVGESGGGTFVDLVGKSVFVIVCRRSFWWIRKRCVHFEILVPQQFRFLECKQECCGACNRYRIR